MAITKCRICGGDFFSQPLLFYDNMPQDAQTLPLHNDIHNNTSISFNICQCRKCSVIQLDCEPPPYYKDVVRAVGISEDTKTFRRKYFQQFLKRFIRKPNIILEAGCGCGDYLEIFKELGMLVVGWEHNAQSLETCWKRGLWCVHKGYDECNETEPIDAFCSFNFLEHCPNIPKYLKNIYDNTTDDAVGLIEVPNFGMMKMKGLFSEFISDHLYYFTFPTLCRTLENSGFQVIDMKSICDDYILSATVVKRESEDLSKFNIQQKETIKEINDYIGTSNNVGIYGAGHQALTILTMINYNQIRFVIDDAPFKQERLTPVTYTPIITLEEGLSCEPDTILVIGGGYSDEIVKKLQSAKFQGSIAKLQHQRIQMIQ